MRMSTLFSRTLRERPSEADVVSHQLLLRAGYVRQLAAGIFSALPLGMRVMAKIERMMREEIERIGGQELRMPVVHPAELWQRSRRYYLVGPEMARFEDRGGRGHVLAMTHEEVVADLARQEISSYRQLPVLLYHIQTKFRDDPRPRAGLIRLREFTMLDSYSLDTDDAGLERQYAAHREAYRRLFARCALPLVEVGADQGIMGGTLSHEYMYLTPIGEDTLVLCDGCGYADNRQIARRRKTVIPGRDGAIERVETPGSTTIEALARYLEIDPTATAKIVFLVATCVDAQGEAEEQPVVAVVRGDMTLNETKLANLLDARALRPARDEEIRALGAVPGYASPIGLRDATVVVDELIPDSAGLVAGANEEGVHLRHVTYERDYRADHVADIAAAEAGDPCPRCGEPLRHVRGIEVANIFKLGTDLAERLGADYLDQEGERRPIVMGSYGIGVERLVASIAQEHHDEHGLLWPITVAPYALSLLALGDAARPAAERLYGEMQQAGIEVLFDDRDERAGVLFADADLLGLPLRLTVSRRSLAAGGAELKGRPAGHEPEIVPLDQVVTRVRDEILTLRSALVPEGS